MSSPLSAWNDSTAKSAIIRHDDAEREIAYDREFKLSPLADALDKVADYGITVVSMKNDRKTVFPDT
jgi:hypothetical protein